jgi:hypothetical protein
MHPYILVHRHTKRQTAFEKEIIRMGGGGEVKMRQNLETSIFYNTFSYHTHEKSNKKFWEELIAYFPLIRHGLHIK